MPVRSEAGSEPSHWTDATLNAGTGMPLYTLQVPPGTPLAEIATKTYDLDARVVEYSRGVVQTGRYPIALYRDWRVESDGDAPAGGA